MKNKNLVQFTFILLAIVLMGMSVKAQYTSGGPGTSSYYNRDDVARKSKQVKVNRLSWIQIGGDPQVRGGLTEDSLGPGEKDVPLDREIEAMTMSGEGTLYIGRISPVVNGVQIYVRIIVATGDIIAIVNCGNWARDLGRHPVPKPTTLDCPKNPLGMQTISDTTVGDTRTITRSDGCLTEITNTTVTVLPGTNTETKVCIEGSWIEVVRAGNDRGKVSGKKFLAESMIPEKIRAAILAQEPDLKGKKVKFLQVLQGACENEHNKFKLIWFTGEGWHWKEFLIGFGAGFITGYIVRGTPDCPVLIPPTGSTKIQPGTNGNTRPNITPSNPGTANSRPRIIP